MDKTACAKCGCTTVIPDVRIIDHGDGNDPLDLCATVYANPEAWVFKGPVSHKLRARVCGDCGFTEFYVDNPGRLLEIATRASADG
jgi:predicted nucleic-acid-binding Zn-ribbon protein